MANSIFHYSDYREYLKDFYSGQKARKNGFNYQKFSEKAQLKSPNYLKLVMDGKRNMTPKNMVKFSFALNLTGAEADYFESLVSFNQAKKPLEREYYQKRLEELRSTLKINSDHELKDFEFENIATWLDQTILVMSNLTDFRDDVGWIRFKIYYLASHEQIAGSLNRLKSLGLLVKSTNGRWMQSQRLIRTKDELTGNAIRKFYDGVLDRAKVAMQITSPSEREYGSFFVSIKNSKIRELKRRVRNFLRETAKWASEDENPHEVYSLNFFAFPVTGKTKEK